MVALIEKHSDTVTDLLFYENLRACHPFIRNIVVRPVLKIEKNAIREYCFVLTFSGVPRCVDKSCLHMCVCHSV